MADLQNPKWMYLKGTLFLLILISSTLLILLEHPDPKLAILLGLAIWSAARLYYFMFYVIEKYIDHEFKFSGIGSFIRYLFRRQRDE